ncbi:tetratricopeptide repeat protein [Methanosarcina horonobensis]|uniref:tetratricopeptide repeat protein n=1 Tax=Methanosarcina horonobensis TaxID=418008 RepID=UPI002FCE3C42
MHYKEGNYREAVSMYEDSLKIYPEVENKIEIMELLDRLGEANFKQNNYEGAIDSYSKSLEIKKELKKHK